jgi:dephospho-CoA kinase
MTRNRLIIGLTGGSGVGKGEVCHVFSALACGDVEIIDTDSLAHQVISRSSSYPAYEQIVAAFGPEILDDNNEINRKKLGAIVFANKKKLNMLSSIVHKYVIQRCFEIVENGEKRLVIIDAPALVEAGMKEYCDIVLGIFAPLKTRIERICARDGLTEIEAKRRVNSQMPDEELAEHADFRIDNTGSLEELYEKIADFFNTNCVGCFSGVWECGKPQSHGT